MKQEGDIRGPDAAEPPAGRLLPEQLDLLIGRLDALPCLPAALARLVEPAPTGGAGVQLLPAVAADPALAGWTLRQARERRPDLSVQTLEQAVDALGATGLRSAALGLKTWQPAGQGEGSLDYPEFCRHSRAVAAAAGAIARRMQGGASPALAETAGLLHDIGKAVLDRCLLKSYRRVLAAVAGGRGNIAQAEQAIIGLDHTVAGRRLARHWRLPPPIEQAIFLHHQPFSALTGEENGALAAAVQLADAIARERRLGFSGNYVLSPSSAELAAEMGLSPQDAGAVAEELPARLAEFADQDLLQAEAGYLTAVAAAAAELDRINQELSRQAAQWQRQAAALEQLRDFVRQVTPASSLPALCRQVARLFARAAGIAEGDLPTAAFAISDQGKVTLAILHRQGKDVFGVIPCRAAPAPPQGRCLPGTVLNDLADPEAWSGLLNPGDFLLVPLLAGGTWQGGVLLPRAAVVPADGEELSDALGEVTGCILAAAVGRAGADRLAEQLARTSRRLAETTEALAQAKMLAAVGEMAAGAAHELNNPLTVISGRAQLIAERAKTKADREGAELIARKAQEISSIATELMAVARPPAPRFEAVAVGDLLVRVRTRFLAEAQQKGKPPTVDIQTRTPVPTAWADAEQIEGVLTELLRNALTAGGGGVKIVLEALAGPEGRGTEIRVSDNGPGMDAATLAAAFTPFFSRRPAGRGRGMGLTRAQRTLQANGGRLWLESRPQQGTTAFIQLPAPPERAKKA